MLKKWHQKGKTVWANDVGVFNWDIIDTVIGCMDNCYMILAVFLFNKYLLHTYPKRSPVLSGLEKKKKDFFVY